jgi:hypothetical protein
MTLEDLVNEKNGLLSNSNYIDENPNDSYKPRKAIGQALSSDWPIEFPDPQAYLNKDSVCKEFTRQSVKKREDAIKEIVKSDLSKYVAKLKNEELIELGLMIDKEYSEIYSAKDNPSKWAELIGKYSSKPELCFDLISTSYNPQEAMQKSYKALLNIKRMEIEKKNKLYEINDKKKVFNRDNIENYFKANLETSKDEIKDQMYLAIANLYCKSE